MLLKQSTILDKGAPLELKFASSGNTATIAGYGATFGDQPDTYGDIIRAGAFAETLKGRQASDVVMLWQHSTSDVIGLWTEIREDETGLYVKGQLNLETQRGREAASLVKQGALNGLSIGFRVQSDGAEMTPEGLRQITKAELWEVSLVTFPANTNARLKRSSDFDQVNSRGDLERFLKSGGAPNALAKRIAHGGWPGDRHAVEIEDITAALKAATHDIDTILKG
ncbi:HK97 family phage prohead protease [Roseibium aquae]|uniref:HK97 family phage prohead protease n=2 Tax=Roseibium aquae TaxID=1323746 RepID=UPI001561CE72|nr:HK97 family phage prohead protease [Roseibium aquae]